MVNLRLSCVTLAALVTCSLLSPLAAQTRPAPATSAGAKAGNITALLPVAKITRGVGKAQTVTEAAKGDEVVWNDLVKTEKGGRARITLVDQSILSLGSQAELRIVKHDARTQQTAIQLSYGRLRAEVASVTRDGGRFELRTPTAVAGVIGTDFGSDSSFPGITNFLCISGIVQVSNADPSVPGQVPCPAGSTTSVSTGLAPTAPKPATQQQIQQLIQDTEPAVISSFSPATALLGTTVETAVSGSKMLGINSVSISGDGATASLIGASTETGANVRVVVSPTATAGSRTLTFTKSNGQSTAAVFTLLSPPKSEGGGVDTAALKKSYLEIIDQERLSAINGVNAVGIGVQQGGAETAAAFQKENEKLTPPMDTARLDAELQTDVAPMLQAMTAAGTRINEEAAATGKELDTAFDALQRRFEAQRTPPTEEQKSKAAKDTFDAINARLLAKITAIHDGLADPAKSVNASYKGTLDKWMEALKIEAARQKTLPTPKVDADERSYDVGLMATFDAIRSTPVAGTSITSYTWILCDPGYKPQQVGIPIAANDTKCHPMAGYSATTSDFKFQTCDLTPQDYIARVTITDSTKKAAAMDVRVRVLPPSYDAPGIRVRGLADAYQQLQPNAFTVFFDDNYSGLSELQESIRRTFNRLASMNINLRLSQASISCNEATVRADWDQNYTFKEDQTCANEPAGSLCQKVVFKQTEQLTARMRRIPGKNWFITDFQGDNGTVQGSPPGPIQRDTALPDFVITSVTTFTGPRQARENEVRSIGVSPGPNDFSAVIQNIGTADLQGSVRVRFVLRDENGNDLASDVQDFPGPLVIGASATVIGHVIVPDVGPGGNARIYAQVNPGCAVTEKNCDGSNATLLDLIVGTVDLQVVSFVQVGTAIGTQAGSVDVAVKNNGSRTSNPTVGNLGIYSGITLLGSTSIPSLTPGSSATVNLPFIAPNGSGIQPVTVAISPASPGEANLPNDSLAGTVNLIAPVVDVAVSGLAFSGSTPPYVSGQSVSVIFNLANAGNRPTAPTDTISCTLSGTPGNAPLPPMILPAVPAAGNTNGVLYTFVVPINFVGANTLTCTVPQDPFEAAGNLVNNSTNLPMAVAVNIDLQVVNVVFPAADQMGANSSVSFGIKNFGADTAAAGWDVPLVINTNQVGTYVSTAPLLGGATLPVIINYVVPQTAPAPVDVANIPATLHVNNNNVIAESNIANNTFATNLRLVDFTLSTIPTFTLQSVIGRTFTANVISIQPVTYPLPIAVQYAGVPAGIIASGVNGVALSGIPTAAGGPFTVSASATVNGVNHASNLPFNIQLNNEITLTPQNSPSLTAAQGGGPILASSVAVAGGIYPLTLSFVQPTGVAITGPLVLAAPGNVSYNLSANQISIPGAQTYLLTASDVGSAPNTPGNSIPSNIPFSVVSYVDMQVQPYLVNPAGPYVSGTSITVQVPIFNAGNVASSAADTLTCNLTGTPGNVNIRSGVIASIPPQTALTVPVVFIMPINRAPLSSIDCTVSQDPLETAGLLADNFRALSVNINPNIDLTVIAVTPPAINQMGSNQAINVTVKNLGLDTANAGWDVGIKINGANAGTPILGPILAGGATTIQSPVVPIPQIGTPPTNNLNYSLQALVNTNVAVPETLATNNSLTSTINLVDFRILQVSAGGPAVVGRTMALTPAVSIDPPAYPLPLTVNYTGLPAGTAGSGVPFGQNVSGTPTAAGAFPITVDATVSGVNRTMTGNIPLNVSAEITPTLGAPFASLVSTAGGQPLQIDVTGGIYPVTVTLPVLPVGVTAIGPTSIVLNAPGSAIFNLQSSFLAVPGPFNLNLTLSDNGSVATTTPPKTVNFLVNGTVTGQSNYVLNTATLALPHTTGTGADAFQVGETVVLNFTAKNVGNLTQAGNLTVTLATACGGPFNTNVPAPAAGATVNGAINFPIGCAPASYNETVTITASPVETSAADNSIGPVAFQVFDFSVINTTGYPLQNILIGGSPGLFNINVGQFGPAAPLSLPLSITNGGKATTNPTGTVTAAAGNVISVTSSGSAVSGDNENIVSSITRFGVTKNNTQPIRLYTAAVNNITAGAPGSTSAAPVVLGIGLTGSSVDFRLVGTFSGAATFQPPSSAGFTINVGSTPSLPNDTFTVTVSAINGAPATVVSIPLVFNIPNTNPAQTVSTTLFVRAFAPSNVVVGTPSGTGTAFGARNFTIFPVLSGEAGDLAIPISNTGIGATTPNLNLRVRFGSSTGAILNPAAVLVPSIPPGGNTVVTARIVAPDPLTTGSSVFFVEVDHDPVEVVFTDNSNSMPINTSDWSMLVTGPGAIPGSELSIVVPTPGSASTTVTVLVNNGAAFAPIALTSSSSRFITGIVPVSISNGQTVLVTASASPDAPIGPFILSIAGRMLNGTTVTTQRVAQIFLNVIPGLGNLPDLQIKAFDVAISPSIPKPGDTLDVRFKVFNVGAADAIDVPIALQVNGTTMASDTLTIKAGESTLGGLQSVFSTNANSSANRKSPALGNKNDMAHADDAVVDPGKAPSLTASLVIDPENKVKQLSTTNKFIALTKGGLRVPDSTFSAAAERVYLEMNTTCAGFRVTSGAVGDCEGGADLDISIDDLANSRYSLNARNGVADLGDVNVSTASAGGAQFSSRVNLVLGHTYAVQMSGDKVGFVRFSASLTPRQLAAEAAKRFGLQGVRILRKMGVDTGATLPGDVSGHISADALMYLDMTFRP